MKLLALLGFKSPAYSTSNEEIAGQLHLPVDEYKPIETYHQLIQQHKRLICCIIGLR